MLIYSNIQLLAQLLILPLFTPIPVSFSPFLHSTSAL